MTEFKYHACWRIQVISCYRQEKGFSNCPLGQILVEKPLWRSQVMLYANHDTLTSRFVIIVTIIYLKEVIFDMPKSNAFTFVDHLKLRNSRILESVFLYHRNTPFLIENRSLKSYKIRKSKLYFADIRESWFIVYKMLT